MHRQLYAHNSGLLDDEYIDNIRQITGEDIRTHPSLAQSNYPKPTKSAAAILSALWELSCIDCIRTYENFNSKHFGE